MRHFVTAILLLLITIQTFSNWIIIGEFHIYRKYITKNLCENRYRPKFHCNGKCVLMKKMAAEQHTSDPAGVPRVNWESALFVSDHLEFPNVALANPLRHLHAFLATAYSNPYWTDIFRPPIV